MILAFDLGGSCLRAALLEELTLLEVVQCPTPQPASPSAVLETAWQLAQPLLSSASAIGVACAGAVVAGRVTPTASATYPDWQDVPVQQWFSQHSGLPCTVLNDARAAAWGEYRAGAGRGQQDFMFVTVSTGVGAGLILGGRLHLAQNGLDAELGFTNVPSPDSCWASAAGYALGPLEQEASGKALQQAAQRLGYETAAALCDAAETGVGEAQEPYQRSAELLAWRLADVAALLGVSKVALGGSVGLRPGYQVRVQEALSRWPVRFQPEVVAAELGAQAGLVGAGAWVLASFRSGGFS